MSQHRALKSKCIVHNDKLHVFDFTSLSRFFLAMQCQATLLKAGRSLAVCGPGDVPACPARRAVKLQLPHQRALKRLCLSVVSRLGQAYAEGVEGFNLK